MPRSQPRAEAEGARDRCDSGGAGEPRTARRQAGGRKPFGRSPGAACSMRGSSATCHPCSSCQIRRSSAAGMQSAPETKRMAERQRHHQANPYRSCRPPSLPQLGSAPSTPLATLGASDPHRARKLGQTTPAPPAIIPSTERNDLIVHAAWRTQEVIKGNCWSRRGHTRPLKRQRCEARLASPPTTLDCNKTREASTHRHTKPHLPAQPLRLWP